MGGIRKVIKNDRGFTLIELMVVIVIIGIIAAIAVPRFVNAISDARAETDKANIKMLQSAVERVYAKTGSYPNTLNDLVNGGYIKSIPKDPQNDEVYSLSNGIVSCDHFSGQNY
ncbi:type II secretion system protein G [Thermincola ferriacetica]|uniref:Type II secretion system protein G n=1 Tax=Thermincola ferriacetica TaxID=281456 RepID=A0A0L6W6E6_9FIRM|nr:prepilin-type N-terminal cleavage/methylation domain-containing protein [Thermincola ferriacetica]KNZ70684.1 type II secretion system protein G [Thermincola ferriacetica]